MYETSRRLLGDTGSGLALKATFAGHFTGGETSEDVHAVAAALDRHGIGAILDYAAEGSGADSSRCICGLALDCHGVPWPMLLLHVASHVFVLPLLLWILPNVRLC